ncbi:MAG: hypothetical protein A3F17_02845 [Gammaproteobacteria bacterium RIFCSPHIGHO2_12_FULL_41_15]|nr:MAG: hypothetical protein A3F17_02845 [Gammaproteobacteria bacterium RIFCSPHIGHO2_12_FULL_41_15]
MESVFAQAMRWLVIREHSEKELRRKLAKKGYAETKINEVMLQLIEQGLQSDQRYTEAWCRAKISAGYGPLKIKYDLKQQGIAESIIANTVSNDDVFWLEQLQIVWQKKYRKIPATAAEHQKQARFLQSRGFDFSLINKIILQKIDT